MVCSISIRSLNALFSSCSLRIRVASESMRASVGRGMHWNIVARKLCTEIISVSCHCFAKYTLYTG